MVLIEKRPAMPRAMPRDMTVAMHTLCMADMVAISVRRSAARAEAADGAAGLRPLFDERFVSHADVAPWCLPSIVGAIGVPATFTQRGRDSTRVDGVGMLHESVRSGRPR